MVRGEHTLVCTLRFSSPIRSLCGRVERDFHPRFPPTLGRRRQFPATARSLSNPARSVQPFFQRSCGALVSRRPAKSVEALSAFPAHARPLPGFGRTQSRLSLNKRRALNLARFWPSAVKLVWASRSDTQEAPISLFGIPRVRRMSASCTRIHLGAREQDAAAQPPSQTPPSVQPHQRRRRCCRRSKKRELCHRGCGARTWTWRNPGRTVCGVCLFLKSRMCCGVFFVSAALWAVNVVANCPCGCDQGCARSFLKLFYYVYGLIATTVQ